MPSCILEFASTIVITFFGFFFAQFFSKFSIFFVFGIFADRVSLGAFSFYRIFKMEMFAWKNSLLPKTIISSINIKEVAEHRDDI